MEEAGREARTLRSEPFPPEFASIPASRNALLRFLDGEVPREHEAVAALLATELATNALLHAGTAFTVCADLTPYRLRVEVADGSQEPPVVKYPAPDEVGGRGLLLVSELAERWGTQPIPDGKLVWFELPIRWREIDQAVDLGDPQDPPHHV